jgi:hypothetical protein
VSEKSIVVPCACSPPIWRDIYVGVVDQFPARYSTRSRDWSVAS